MTSPTADPSRIVRVTDFEPLARAWLDPAAYDYIAGGSWDEVTLAENEAAWLRRRFRPRVLVDVSRVSTATTMAGAPAALPLAIAPMSVHELAHPEAELATVRAAAAAGVPFTLSTMASRSIEEVAEAAPDAIRWFQLYLQQDPRRVAVVGRTRRDSRLPGDRPDRGPAGHGLPRTRSAVRLRPARPRQLPRRRAQPPAAAQGRSRGSRGAARRDQPHLGRHRGDPVMVVAAARAQGHPDRRGRTAGRRARRRRRSSSATTAPASWIASPASVDVLPRSSRRSPAGLRCGSTVACGAASTSPSRSPSVRGACSSAGPSCGRSRPTARPAWNVPWRSSARSSGSALALLGTPTPADIRPEHLAG